MEQHDDVEVVLDRPPVARLLVAAVAEVARVPDDSQWEATLGPVFQTHLVGGVLTRVVAHQYFCDAIESAQGACQEPRRE